MTPAKPIKNNRSGATIEIVSGKTDIQVRLSGRLDRHNAAEPWRKTLRLLSRHLRKPIHIDASGLEFADGSGIPSAGFFKHYGQSHQIDVQIDHGRAAGAVAPTVYAAGQNDAPRRGQAESD